MAASIRRVARDGRGPKISELMALELPRDGERLGALPAPEQSRLAAASMKTKLKAAEHFGGLWRQLALETFEGADWFWAALRGVGSYFSYGIYDLAVEAGSKQALEVLQRIGGDEDGGLAPDSVEGDIQRIQAEDLLSSFASCASSLLFAAKVDEIGLQPGNLPPALDADLNALEALSSFHAGCTELDGEPLELAQTLLARAMDFRREAVHSRSEERGKLLQKPAALVDFGELVLLSKRDGLIAKKHGVKGIEKAFEERLGAIFKTLGFVPVPARPGKAVVDILCVSPEPQLFSFLVEAKTSKAPYKLPKDDYRAIRDYARDFPLRVPNLKPFEFILVVGPSYAETLPERLQELQAEIRLPVRFASADLIALLQQEVAGPVEAAAFRDAVVRSEDPILDERLVDQVKAESQRYGTALSKFVYELMP